MSSPTGARGLDLVVATTNRGKLAEFERLFAGLPVRLLGVQAVGPLPAVAETEDDYAENARRKAVTAARATGRLALSDDSGLEVSALNGRPGPLSARLAGTGASDAQNRETLLSLLASIQLEQRQARFVCVLAFATPEGAVQCFTGECAGRIALSPRGEGGFGYDPIFIPAEGPGEKTLAELGPKWKDRISHRARAVAAAREWLGRTERARG